MTEKRDLVKLVKETPFPWSDSLLKLFVGGSGMHGATGDKSSDLDICGIYIQPVELILGVPKMREVDGKMERFGFDPDVQVWSTGGEAKKNIAEDIDTNFYSLRKWAGMAASGNATALEFLFCVQNEATPHNATIWNKHIAANTDAFVAARAGYHFLQFAGSMLDRINGIGTGKHGQREEVIHEFGYDTKAAMHLIRVLTEGIELMETGKIVLPHPNKEFLKDIRRGKYLWKDIEAAAGDYMSMLRAVHEKSALPPHVDRERISKVITAAQIEFWSWSNEPTVVLAKAFNIASWHIAQSVQIDSRNIDAPWSDEKVVRREILDLAMKINNGDKP